MIVKHYYKATRDPARGGLHIAETSMDFPEDCRKCINENILELITSDYQGHACAVYPMGDGRFIVSMARKVRGNKVESRPHEIIHGIVLNSVELIKLCRNNMAQEWFPQIFFPAVTKGEMELAGEGFYESTDDTDYLGEFKKSMNGHRLIGFYKMLTEVISKKRKVQLLVPKGMERIVQALCYDVLQNEERNHLFVISNGECTMSDADILITQRIVYQNPKKYRTMTLEEFIAYGMHVKPQKVPVEEKPKRMTVEDGIERCVEYIQDLYQPESVICMIRKELMEQSEEACEEFQMKLRCELETMEIEKEQLPDYVKVMCLAFENYKGVCKDRKQTLLPPPYDMQGMRNFLEMRCTSQKEVDRYIKEILELQLKAYDGLSSKRKIKEVIRRYRREKEN